MRPPRAGRARLAAALLALLLAAGCTERVSPWDKLEGAIASAREGQDHPRAVELSRRLVVLAREHPPVDSTRLVHSYDVLQQSLMGAGIYPEALTYQDHAIGLLDGMQHPDSLLLRRLLAEAADAARRSGRPDDAERYLARAVAMHRASGFADREAAVRAVAALARTRAVRGRLAEAESLQRVAIEVRAAWPDTTGLELARLRLALADLVDQRGRAADAESLYVDALRAAARTLGEAHPMVAEFELAYGRHLHAHGRHAEAAVHLERGTRLWAASPAYDAAAQAEYLHQLAGSYARSGEWDRARVAAERAIALHEHAAPSPGPLPRTWVSDLAIIYVQLGRSAAAESLLARHPGEKPDPER